MPIQTRLILALPGVVIGVPPLLLYLRARFRLGAAQGWAKSEGRILSATTVIDETDEDIVYRPVIRYAFRAGDDDREGSRVRLLDDGRTVTRAKADALVGRYPPGTIVSVRYDPRDPALSCLDMGAPPKLHLRVAVLGLALAMLSLLVPTSGFSP